MRLKGGSLFPCFARLTCVSMMRQLFDVVNQAIEVPLRVHLGLRSQRESIEVLVVPQVGEDGLDNGDAPAVEFSPPVAVNRALHDLSVAKRRCLVLVEER